jgi:TetR/AcrR family transcriptional repressor of uid operon
MYSVVGVAVPFINPQRHEANLRERLAATCLVDIVEHGFGSVSLDGVARRAGITYGAARRCFDDVDELVEHAVADELGRVMGELSARFLAGDDASEVIVDVFAYTVRRLRDHPVMRQLLGPESARLMAYLRGDAPETLIVARAFLAEELFLLGERTATPLDDEAGAEFFIRVGLSLVISPDLGPDPGEPGVIESVARQWLLPGMLAPR